MFVKFVNFVTKNVTPRDRLYVLLKKSRYRHSVLIYGLTGSRTSIFCLIYIIFLIVITYSNVFLKDRCLFFQIIIYLTYCIHVFSCTLGVKYKNNLPISNDLSHQMTLSLICLLFDPCLLISYSKFVTVSCLIIHSD